MPITATESGFNIEPGMYNATLNGWEEAEGGNFGPGIKLIWALDDVVDADGDPVTKWQFASQRLTPRSKLWAILETLGHPPVLGQTYELADLLDPLIGARASLVIKNIDGRDKIVDVMPMPERPVAAAQPKRPAAPGTRKADDLPSDMADGMSIGGCFICDAPGVAFDNRGRPVCDRHTAA